MEDVAADSSGLYLAGYDYTLKNSRWHLEKRSLTDGSLLWEQINNPSDSNDYVVATAVDKEGVYFAGTDFANGNNQWRIEKRDLITGNIIWTMLSNPSSKSNQAQGLALYKDFLFVGGWDSANGDSQ